MRQTPGERHAPAADADERQFVDLMIAFEDFVGDSTQRAAYVGRFENGLVTHVTIGRWPVRGH